MSDLQTDSAILYVFKIVAFKEAANYFTLQSESNFVSVKTSATIYLIDYEGCTRVMFQCCKQPASNKLFLVILVFSFGFDSTESEQVVKVTLVCECLPVN